MFSSVRCHADSCICEVWPEAVRLWGLCVRWGFWEDTMSINSNANADLYSQCAAGDTESNEATPLLTNVSTEITAVSSVISDLQRCNICGFFFFFCRQSVSRNVAYDRCHVSVSSAFCLCQHFHESPALKRNYTHVFQWLLSTDYTQTSHWESGLRPLDPYVFTFYVNKDTFFMTFVHLMGNKTFILLIMLEGIQPVKLLYNVYCGSGAMFWRQLSKVNFVNFFQSSFYWTLTCVLLKTVILKILQIVNPSSSP